MYNILICDDEQDIVNALKIYLANPDYHCWRPTPVRRLWMPWSGRTSIWCCWTL